MDANTLIKALSKVDEDHFIIVEKDCIEVYRKKDFLPTPTSVGENIKQGMWVKANAMTPPEYHHRKCCSVCGSWAPQDFFGRERLSFFCPHCGVSMKMTGD